MNQRKDSAHHKRALKEARMAKLLFSLLIIDGIFKMKMTIASEAIAIKANNSFAKRASLTARL